LVPVVNESAFTRRSRVGQDGLDLARTCPGRSDGSITEQVAHELTALIQNADYYIDLHSGGAVMQVEPLSGYMLVAEPKVLDAQRRLARAFGLPIIWGTSAKLDGRSLSAARDAGVPAIYTEYLGAAGCDKRGVDAYLNGCLNVMANLEMIAPRPEPASPELFIEDPRPQSGHLQLCHPSPGQGYFDPNVALGDVVSVGQTLGSIVDPLGTTSTPMNSRQAGRVIALRNCGAVMEQDALAVILETT
jgi:predicted deacylase